LKLKAPQSTPSAVALLAGGRPLVIGHRGFAEAAPENTLPSFELALDVGADLVELDFRLSKDGVPVVVHDRTLDRTTNARSRWRRRRIPVASKTAAELATLDAGAWFDPKFAGAGIPRLADALDIIQARGVALIERKAGAAADCIALLRQKGLINRVIVQSFDWHFLLAFHEAEPAQVLGALGPPAVLANGRRPAAVFKRLSARWLDELRKTGAKIAVWDRRVSKGAIHLAHERGLKVWVYTVNETKLARRLLHLGVDGIITNNPVRIKSLQLSTRHHHGAMQD
jgi:glycerophosphoryl diester phosphodiesterase